MFQGVIYILKAKPAVDEPSQQFQMEIKKIYQVRPDDFLTQDDVYAIIGMEGGDAGVIAYFGLN